MNAYDEMALEEELARVPLRRTTWRRVLKYLAPHKGPLLFGVSIESFWIILMITDPYLVRRAVDGPLAKGDIGGVLGYVAAIVVLLAFRAFITVIELRITTRIGVDAIHALRKDVFDHLQRLSMRYFDRTKQGRILARADRDVDALEHILGWGPVSLANIVSCLVFAFARLTWVHPHLAPYVLAALPVLWGLTRLFERFGWPAFRRIRETHSAISAHVAEDITGVRVVKAFAAEAREVEDLRGLQAAYRFAVMRGTQLTGGYVPSLIVAIQALVVVALLTGGQRVLSEGMTVGVLLESIWLLGMALPSASSCCSTRHPRSGTRPAPATPGDSRGTSSSATSASRTTPRAPRGASSTASRSTRAPGSAWRSWATRGRARRRC